MKKIIRCIILIIVLLLFLSINVKAEEIQKDLCTEEPNQSETIYLELQNEEELFESLQKDLKFISQVTDLKEWFKSYKSIIQKYSNVFDPPETIYDVFSDEELLYLERMVETENYTAPFECKINVANVAFNRLESNLFPNNLKSVIKQKNQFSYSRKTISEDTILACEYAYSFKDTTDGSLYFHSKNESATFLGAKYVMSDDSGHHFYK